MRSPIGECSYGATYRVVDRYFDGYGDARRYAWAWLRDRRISGHRDEHVTVMVRIHVENEGWVTYSSAEHWCIGETGLYRYVDPTESYHVRVRERAVIPVPEHAHA